MKRVILLAAFGLSTAMAAPILGQKTTRASLGNGGVEGDDNSNAPVLSRNARYAAFWSSADNLVAGDTNGFDDIFVRDRQAGITRRVSVGPAGIEANAGSYDPAISANGRFIAFYSEASDLVAGDTNLVPDVFVHDQLLGVTVRASVDSLGQEYGSRSSDASISDDGRAVAFASNAGFDPLDTGGVDVYVRNLVAGTTTRASVGLLGAQANAQCRHPSLSGDGSSVAFESFADNLVAGDTNGIRDVFVRNLVSGKTVRVSVDSAGVQSIGAWGSEGAALSADGRYVAFESQATNLFPGDTATKDIFVHDLATGSTTLVSLSTGGTKSNALCESPSISSDGRFVAFASQATNLVADDTNARMDVFVRDRLLGTTRRISVDSSGAEGQALSRYPSISPDGYHIGFLSFASNLVPSDTNAAGDAFVHSYKPAALSLR